MPVHRLPEGLRNAVRKSGATAMRPVMPAVPAGVGSPWPAPWTIQSTGFLFNVQGLSSAFWRSRCPTRRPAHLPASTVFASSASACPSGAGKVAYCLPCTTSCRHSAASSCYRGVRTTLPRRDFNPLHLLLLLRTDRPRFRALLHMIHGLITEMPVAWNGAMSRVATVKVRAEAVAAT